MATKPNTHCCVPLGSQRGRVGPEGERIGFFKFPEGQKMKKKWIHAIRRDVGQCFCITEASRVCSLHFSNRHFEGFWWTFFLSHGKDWQQVFKTLWSSDCILIQTIILFITIVVVQFYPWLKIYFPLFLCTVMYDKLLQTKENKIWIKDKIEPQHTHCIFSAVLYFQWKS